jgi:hypothetical protein
VAHHIAQHSSGTCAGNVDNLTNAYSTSYHYHLDVPGAVYGPRLLAVPPRFLAILTAFDFRIPGLNLSSFGPTRFRTNTLPRHHELLSRLSAAKMAQCHRRSARRQRAPRGPPCCHSSNSWGGPPPAGLTLTSRIPSASLVNIAMCQYTAKSTARTALVYHRPELPLPSSAGPFGSVVPQRQTGLRTRAPPPPSSCPHASRRRARVL